MTEQDPTSSPVLAEKPIADPPVITLVSSESYFLKTIFIGTNGLRAGWSTALFLLLTILFIAMLSSATRLLLRGVLHIKTGNGTPANVLVGDVIELLALLAAAAICAGIEKRRIVGYNLTGPSRLRHFLTGTVAGFATVSALVGAMAAGGWLQFGPAALSGVQILQFGALWALAFLLTGFGEEGGVRCYLLFTLARGIDLAWAIGLNAAMCLCCLLFIHNEGAIGIYIMAALGILPILWLQVRKSANSGFWQAAWVTSTFFGFMHTGNDGENWIGIFAAAAIGFIFCVSVRLTGSAWWAIGFHAAWDWAETYFYGTSDSGMIPTGHFLTTTPAGSVLYSGGTDGPEGSLLILPLILLTLAAILLVYSPKRESTSPADQPQLS